MSNYDPMINKTTNKFLFEACYYNNQDKIKIFASIGGNINYALAGAAHGCHFDLVKTLIEIGATDFFGAAHYTDDIKIAHYLIKLSNFEKCTDYVDFVFSKYSHFYGSSYSRSVNKYGTAEINTKNLLDDTPELKELIERSCTRQLFNKRVRHPLFFKYAKFDF